MYLERIRVTEANQYMNIPLKGKLHGKIKTISCGLFLTFFLSFMANQLAKAPFLSIMGVMIISILLGVFWNAVIGSSLKYSAGITFSSKYLLKLGIILMGIRLDFQQILNTGVSVLFIDVIVIIFTLIITILIGKAAAVDRKLAVLIAVGTAVCGAAAIAAVAPVIKAKKEQTVLAVAIIATIGTFGTLVYTFVYQSFNLDPTLYGVLVGSTLQEVAHVIAASAPSGDIGSESAIVAKLGRVALLIPVALVIGFLYNKNDKQADENKKRDIKDLPIPWFIFGFLGFSLINTFVSLPESITSGILSLSGLFMSMAMVALGLGINVVEFKRAGSKPALIGILGFAALVGLGPFLLYLL